MLDAYQDIRLEFFELLIFSLMVFADNSAMRCMT